MHGEHSALGSRETPSHHPSHVANKMLHVLFSVLKNNRPFTPILN
jgi:hypothetical protein